MGATDSTIPPTPEQDISFARLLQGISSGISGRLLSHRTPPGSTTGHQTDPSDKFVDTSLANQVGDLSINEHKDDQGSSDASGNLTADDSEASTPGLISDHTRSKMMEKVKDKGVSKKDEGK